MIRFTLSAIALVLLILTGCDSASNKRIAAIKADTVQIHQSIPDQAALITNWDERQAAIRRIEAMEAEVAAAISKAVGEEQTALKEKQQAIWKLRGAIGGLSQSEMAENKKRKAANEEAKRIQSRQSASAQ
ncbi:hypothetical protein [Ereboglobus luteus]|nr:hypothetical protein [Ereboglobus luteus]